MGNLSAVAPVHARPARGRRRGDLTLGILHLELSGTPAVATQARERSSVGEKAVLRIVSAFVCILRQCEAGAEEISPYVEWRFGWRASGASQALQRWPAGAKAVLRRAAAHAFMLRREVGAEAIAS